jgi:uncharacterized protein YodC (DUF2158 family)
MNEMNFAQGDTVMLKSGGPTMTVEALNWNDTDDVRVVWFSKSNVLRHENFKPCLLKKVEDDDAVLASLKAKLDKLAGTKM